MNLRSNNKSLKCESLMSKGSIDKGSSEENLQPTVEHKVNIRMLVQKEK